ncbi:hypothetical protein JCM10207_009260 [Rhodosporidiobolus poonsookiae]
MAFHPPLATTTFVPLPSDGDKHASTLFFTYLPPPDHPHDAVPEVWTNLPSPSSIFGSREEGEEWHAVAFSPPSPSASPSSTFTASIPLTAQTQPGAFEYTFRLRDPSGALTWLGSDGSNGRVELLLSSSHLSSSAAAIEPPCIARASDGGSGRWKKLAEGVAVGRFEVEKGETVDVGEMLEGGEGVVDWTSGEGMAWEQSSRTWLVPRPLPSPAPLAALSPTHLAQLVVLRSAPSAAHPAPQALVLFPFSTPHVCSSLVGSGEGKGGLRLRMVRDAPPSEGQNAVGHLALAWGCASALSLLVRSCVDAARSTLSGSPFTPLSPAPESAAPDAPHALGLCTWNALGPRYTLSDVLAWLDGLGAPLRPVAEGGAGAGAVRSVLLDDGWQDTASWTDLQDEGGGERAERRALRSFGVRRGWFDVDRTAAPSAPSSARASRPATPRPAEAEGGGGHKRTDSGYGRSPDLSLALEQLDDLTREGVCEELVQAVGMIKARGVERVGVWVTAMGYWHGLHPDSALSDTYDLRLTSLSSPSHPNSVPARVYLPSPADLPLFFRDYFASLRAAGVDFVKLDDQASVDAVVGQEAGVGEDGDEEAPDPGAYRQALIGAFTAAAVQTFGGENVVHCMSGSPRLWGGALGLGLSPSSPSSSSSAEEKSTRAIVRNSDDFFPSEPSSHRWHLAHNARGAVLSGALRMTPCFDMARARVSGEEGDEWGAAHLALRAFQGAPVWATDGAGGAGEKEQEGKEGWASLLATTRAGPRVVQPRTSAPACGAVLPSRLAADPVGSTSGEGSEPLLVGLAVPHAQGAVVGACNALPPGQAARGVLDALDVAEALGLSSSGPAGEAEEGEVVLFSSSTNETTSISLAELRATLSLSRALARPLKTFDLPRPGDVATFSIARVFDLPLEDGSEARIACLGLADKTVGLCAVRSVGVVAAAAEEEEEEEDVPGSPTLTAATGSRLGTPSSVDSLPTPQVPLSPSPSPPGSSTPPLARPLALSRAAFPAPPASARLPFFFAFLTGLPRPSSVRERQPRAELRALLSDLVRTPLRTLVSELGGLVGFGMAVVAWAVGRVAGSEGGARGERRATVEAPEMETAGVPQLDLPLISPTTTKHDAQPNQPPMTAPRGPRLRVQLDYLSPSLVFFASRPSLPPPTSTSTGSKLRLTLDGAPIDEAFVRREGEVVRVDAEGAWRAAGGEEAIGGEGGEGDGGAWTVEVEVVSASV